MSSRDGSEMGERNHKTSSSSDSEDRPLPPRLPPRKFRDPTRHIPDLYGYGIGELMEPLEIEKEPCTIRSLEASRNIQVGGGIIKLAGCTLRVGPSQESNDDRNGRVGLKMEVMNRKTALENHEGDEMLFGPEVILQPEEMHVPDRTTVEVATCYEMIGKQCGSVKVEIKRGSVWEEHGMVEVVEEDRLRFIPRKFGRFRVLLRNEGAFKKSIAHKLYIKEGEDQRFVMTWCFCDDLPEAKLEVNNRMTLLGFQATNLVGSFDIRWRDNVEATLESGTTEIKEAVRMMSPNDLWYSDAMVMLEFEAKDINRERKIKPKIRLI